MDRARTHLRLSGRYDDQDYIEATQQDLTYIFLSAGVSRDLSRSWSVGADYSYWQTNYAKPDVYTTPPFGTDNDESTVGVFAGYKISPATELRGQWQYWFNNVSQLRAGRVREPSLADADLESARQAPRRRRHRARHRVR